MMHVPINVKSPNNISKWQMGFNSAFKGLIYVYSMSVCVITVRYSTPLPSPFKPAPEIFGGGQSISEVTAEVIFGGGQSISEGPAEVIFGGGQ
jgi:hypothetical protein